MAPREKHLSVAHRVGRNVHATYAFTQSASSDSVTCETRVSGRSGHTCEYKGDLLNVARRVGALTIHDGLTETEMTVRWIGIDDLLNALTLSDEPVAFTADTSPSAGDDDMDDEELNDESDEVDEELESSLADGVELAPWRCSVKDLRSKKSHTMRAVIIDGRKYCFAIDQSSWKWEPHWWQPWFSWSFWNESGGPCVWTGGANVGLLAPGLLCVEQHGDLDGPRLTLEAISLHNYVDTFIDQMDEAQLLPDFLRATVGFPARDRVSNERIAALDLQGSSMTIGDNELAHQCLKRLQKSGTTRAAVEALQDPESERGRNVYRIIDALLEKPAPGLPLEQTPDWFQLNEAILDYNR